MHGIDILTSQLSVVCQCEHQQSPAGTWENMIFGSWNVEKVHAVVARSKFPSQKCKKLARSDQFWRSDVARSKFPSQKCKFCGKCKGLCTFCQKWAKREGFVTVSTKTVTFHSTPLHYARLRTGHYTTIHSTTLNYTTTKTTTATTTATTIATTTTTTTTLQLQLQP